MEYNELQTGRGQSYWSLRRSIKKHVNAAMSATATCNNSSLAFENESVCDDSATETEDRFNQSIIEDTVTSSQHDCSSDENSSLNDYFVDSDSESEKSIEFNSADSSDEIEDNLEQFLSHWAVNYAVPLTAVTALLVGLHKYHSQLPRDARTLLKTPRATAVRSLSADGQLWYSGIEQGIKRLYFEDSLPTGGTLELQINVDGLPLFKSSNHQLWPILCKVVQSLDVHPFVVAIYSGFHKPESLDDYLKEFVDECRNIIANGVTVEDCHFSVVLHSFICDAPARAFLKGIKGHNAYSGCERCNVQGDWINNRMLYLKDDAVPRSNDSFRRMSDEDHHVRLSPLTQLPFDMVSGFVLDEMHLLCLGVMRKLLRLWLKGPLTVRLGSRHIAMISEHLLACKQFIPKEFVRKPRPLSELDRFKATELRLFMLYCGVVVLKDNIPVKLYQNFLLLFVACRILFAPILASSSEMCTYAESLLQLFVKDVENEYGRDNIVYNVHNLIHLASDAKKYGSLDTVSAFPFENKLKDLKKMVRKAQYPLQQIIRRLDESQHLVRKVDGNKFPILANAHSKGPMPAGWVGPVKQFAQIRLVSCVLSLSAGNNCALLSTDEPILICNILSTNSGIILLCKKFGIVASFFDYPVSSKKIKVYKVSKEQSTLVIVTLESIRCKCLRLPVSASNQSNEYVVLPLLHCQTN